MILRRSKDLFTLAPPPPRAPRSSQALPASPLRAVSHPSTAYPFDSQTLKSSRLTRATAVEVSLADLIKAQSSPYRQPVPGQLLQRSVFAFPRPADSKKRPLLTLSVFPRSLQTLSRLVRFKQ